jgi:hypothetical protein
VLVAGSAKVERCGHLQVHAADTNPEGVGPLSAEAGDVGVLDVLAVNQAVELAGVLGLDALRLVDGAGRRCVVPTVLVLDVSVLPVPLRRRWTCGNVTVVRGGGRRLC